MALTTVSSTAAVEGSVAQALRGERARRPGRIFELFLLGSLFVSLLILAVLIGRIGRRGVRLQRPGRRLPGGRLSSDPTRAGISQGITGSIWIASVVVISLPLGIAAAIYLEEYAPGTGSPTSSS